VFSIITAYP
jgi:hypothetical protein